MAWAANDRYPQSGDDLLSPASDGAAVTPGTSALPVPSKRLWIGTGGNVSLQTVRGTNLTYTAVPSGTYLQVRAAFVFSSGTTASNIVAEY